MRQPPQFRARTNNEPAHDVRSIVERDSRTLQTILKRWHEFQACVRQERAIVSEHTEVLLHEAERLVEAMDD